MRLPGAQVAQPGEGPRQPQAVERGDAANIAGPDHRGGEGQGVRKERQGERRIMNARLLFSEIQTLKKKKRFELGTQAAAQSQSSFLATPTRMISEVTTATTISAVAAIQLLPYKPFRGRKVVMSANSHFIPSARTSARWAST